MPNADASIVLKTGILNLKASFDEEELSSILPAYNLAITSVFLVAAVMAAITAIASFGMPWRSVKAEKVINESVEP